MARLISPISPMGPIRGKQTARSFSLWRFLRCVRSPLWSEELHDDREKYGREKDPEQSHTNHPGKYGGAQGLAGLGAWPFRDRQGQDTEGERKKRQPNRRGR